MLFHGVINHLILVWEYLYTYFALTFTIIKYLDKLFEQLKDVSLGSFFFIHDSVSDKGWKIGAQKRYF